MIRIIKRIKKLYYSSSNERKIKYLRKLGVTIGDKTRITCDLDFIGTEPYLVTIGSDCLITYGCRCITHDGGVKVLNSANYFHGKKMDKMGRIRIGNNVYFGNNVTILPNVTIGDNVIVGVNSVISKSVPSNVVVAGIPAKVICTLDEYYKKNQEQGRFFPTTGMLREEKKKYLMSHVPQL